MYSRPAMNTLPPHSSSISDETTSDITTVDASCLEIGQPTSAELERLDFDIAFRIDCKPFAARNAVVGHQIMLLVDDVDSRVTDAGITVKSLIDLGIIKFTDKSDDLKDSIVGRVEDRKKLWAASTSLRQIWDALIDEINHYEGMSLNPPHVKDKRPLRVAIGGLKYFNSFSSPIINRLPHVYCSRMKKTKSNDNAAPADNQPSLFR
jgi:hypothetical protein